MTDTAKRKMDELLRVISSKEQMIMDLEDIVARKVPSNGELLECIVMARAEHFGQRDVTPGDVEKAQATALWKLLMRRKK